MVFDELKEISTLKKQVTDFKSLTMQTTLTEIKHLKSLQKAEAYLEPRRASRWSFFVNILHGLLFSHKAPS